MFNDLNKFSSFHFDYFCVAMVDKFAVGAGFHSIVFPQVKAMPAFQPYTATGKLNAVITPTTPTGFQFSKSACPGPENNNTDIKIFELHFFARVVRWPFFVVVT